MNQSGNPIDVPSKDMQVIDLSESDEELPVSVTQFDDEALITFSGSTNKRSTSVYKSLTLRLIDEDTDEEFDNNKSIDEVANDVQNDDYGIDLEYSENESEDDIEDEDDLEDDAAYVARKDF
ncbi:hypothetical protein Tco_0762939 [Tanacetum coccineum]